MSNRKLMGALSILLLALVFIAIGCGDGKRSSKANLRKVNAGPSGNSKDVTQKSKQIDALRAKYRAYIDGVNPVSPQEIEGGSYTLSEIVAFTEFSVPPDHSVALAIGKVSENSGMNDISNDGVGMVIKATDTARLIEVPQTFTIHNGSLGNMLPAMSRTYSLQAGDNRIIHSLSGTSSGQAELLFSKLGGGAAGNIVKTTIGGKEAEITIRKVQGSVRFLVTIFEMKKAPLGGSVKKNADLTKNMIFVYTKTGANQQTQPQVNPAPAPTPAPAPNAAPATVAPPAQNSQSAPQGVPQVTSEQVGPVLFGDPNATN